MSEEEQAINASEWKELHAGLEEVSDKRNRLQIENNRLRILMQLARNERDEAKNELREMTDQRDTLRKYREGILVSRDSARRCAADLQEKLAKMTAERDEAKNELREMTDQRDTLERWWQTERDAAWLKVAIVIDERNAAERERTESRAEVVQLRVERDAALADAEGLRADLRTIISVTGMARRRAGG